MYYPSGEAKEGWFLPSKEELNMMYKNLHKQGLGSFSYYYYWSSSAYYGSDAWLQDFSNGHQSSGSRYSGDYVRAVRAF